MKAGPRGTGRRPGRGREAPSRPKTRPLAPEQAAEAPESVRPRERPTGARTADPAPGVEQIPGQTALELRPMQPTLWSL
ncbi:hypothetical protein GCM10010221_45110 [Streptomyces parvus]|nr:hypothetical protein GCM10010221_45110 [Streptomyces parvus]